MPEAKKYFHIGEILTIYSRVIVCEPGELTAPDGIIKPKWQTMMEPILYVAEFITGQKLWIDKETKEYDGITLMRSMEDIRGSLERQLPWLKDYETRPSYPDDASKEEKNSILQAWIKSAAAQNGQWFTLEPETPAEPTSGRTHVCGKPNTPGKRSG
jgi:hypothetical protein